MAKSKNVQVDTFNFKVSESGITIDAFYPTLTWQQFAELLQMTKPYIDIDVGCPDCKHRNFEEFDCDYCEKANTELGDRLLHVCSNFEPKEVENE